MNKKIVKKLSKTKAAVLGLGNMGRHHARIYHELDSCELVAVIDQDEAIRLAFCEQYQCKGFSNLERCLAETQVDAISIAAPTFLHYKLGKAALENNLHLLIEKPITDSVETAEELIQLANQKNRILAVGHIERFNPAILELKKIIDSGKLGDVYSIHSQRLGMFPSQIKDANVLIDLAVHDIDIICYLFGDRITSIDGESGNFLSSDRADHANLYLKFGNKIGISEVSWLSPIKRRSLTVFASKGVADLDFITQSLQYHIATHHKSSENGIDHIKLEHSETIQADISKGEPLKAQLSHFIDCIEQNQTPQVCGNQGKTALEIALSALKKLSHHPL